jgi:hypothetical protein
MGATMIRPAPREPIPTADDEIEAMLVDLVISHLTGDQQHKALAWIIKAAAAHRHLQQIGIRRRVITWEGEE